MDIRHVLIAPRPAAVLFFLGFGIAASLTIFAADQPDAKGIEGSWVPVQAELGARPMPDAVLQTISLKLSHGSYEVWVGSQQDQGSYTLDASTKPKGMSITGTDGPNKGKTFPAIYEINGDTLRICYDLSGQKRPEQFQTVAGTKLYLVTYHRKKG